MLKEAFTGWLLLSAARQDVIAVHGFTPNSASRGMRESSFQHGTIISVEWLMAQFPKSVVP
jgi:hypothetical protein